MQQKLRFEIEFKTQSGIEGVIARTSVLLWDGYLFASM
jgi:hypothetical protein